MAAVEVKSFDAPDETRPFEGKGKADVLVLAGHPVARGVFEPGWKWSNNLKPIAQTDSCEVSHLGYCVSGRMKIYMDDGTEAEVGPGEAAAIPPGGLVRAHAPNVVYEPGERQIPVDWRCCRRPECADAPDELVSTCTAASGGSAPLAAARRPER